MKSKMDDNMFEVEGILDKRTNEKGQIQYKILWKGFSEDHASWQPAWTLKTINNLILQFQQQIDNLNKQKIANKNKSNSKVLQKLQPQLPIKRSNKTKMIQDKKREKLEPKGIIRNHEPILKNNQFQDNKHPTSKRLKMTPSKQLIKIQETLKNHSKPDLFKLKLDQKLKKDGIIVKPDSQTQSLQNNQIIQPDTVEVLKIIFKGPQHKRMFEIRVGNIIIQMQALKAKQTYPVQLCTFYQRCLRFDY